MLIIFAISNNIFVQIMNPPMIPSGNRVDWTVSGLTIQGPTDYNLIIDVTKPLYNVTPNRQFTASIIARLPSRDIIKFFFKPIKFDLQFSNLSV